MTVREKQELIGNYCGDTLCSECALNRNSEHLCWCEDEEIDEELGFKRHYSIFSTDLADCCKSLLEEAYGVLAAEGIVPPDIPDGYTVDFDLSDLIGLGDTV